MGITGDIKTILGINKPPPLSTPSPRKVLIVEDDQSLAAALQDAFTNAGFEVYLAENGKIGLEVVKQAKPDVILLDLIMPVMDGKVMLSKLRAIPECKLLPVIVLTNAGQVDNIRETVDYDRAVEFLIKSNVSLDEVVEKVRRSY